MINGNQLAKKLKDTGTGEDKLAVCRSCKRADTAVEALLARNWHATARKANVILAANEVVEGEAQAVKDKVKPAASTPAKPQTPDKPKPQASQGNAPAKPAQGGNASK